MATYGGNGNRWWVAYNTAQSTSGGTQLLNGGNVNPDTPSGYESLPSGDAVDDALFAAAALVTKAKGPSPAGKGPTVTVEHVIWANVNGPYLSQSAANAAIPAIQKAEPAPSGSQEVQQTAASAFGGVSNLITDAEDILSDITSVHFWERAAMIVIGATLLIVGGMHITGLDKKAAEIAKHVPIVV